MLQKIKVNKNNNVIPINNGNIVSGGLSTMDPPQFTMF